MLFLLSYAPSSVFGHDWFDHHDYSLSNSDVGSMDIPEDVVVIAAVIIYYFLCVGGGVCMCGAILMAYLILRLLRKTSNWLSIHATELILSIKDMGSKNLINIELGEAEKKWDEIVSFVFRIIPMWGFLKSLCSWFLKRGAGRYAVDLATYCRSNSFTRINNKAVLCWLVNGALNKLIDRINMVLVIWLALFLVVYMAALITYNHYLL